jgi:hypothetical protein
MRIGDHVGWRRVRRESHVPTGRPGRHLGLTYGGVKELLDRELVRVQRHRTGFQSRHVEQVGHEATEPFGLRQGGVQRRGVRDFDTVHDVSRMACNAKMGVRNSCETFAMSSRRC